MGSQAKISNRRLKGSISLTVSLEKQDGFLEGSASLSQRTADYLQLLHHLSASPDLKAWPDASQSPDFICPGTNEEVEPAKVSEAQHLDIQNKSLRAIVADQRGQIDALKDLMLCAEQPSRSACNQRGASATSSRASAQGKTASDSTPKRSTGHVRTAATVLPRSNSGPQLLQTYPAKASISEYERFMREHAHQKKLQPFIMQHLFHPNGSTSVGETTSESGCPLDLNRPFSAREIRSQTGFEIPPEVRRNTYCSQHGRATQAGLPRPKGCDVNGCKIPARFNYPYEDYSASPAPRPLVNFREHMHLRFEQDVPPTAAPQRPQRSTPTAPSGIASRPRYCRPDAVEVADENNLRRALLRHFQSPLSAFKSLDLDHDGALSLVEFRRAFDLARLEISEDKVLRLWRRAKGTEDQHITMSQFTEFLLNGR